MHELFKGLYNQYSIQIKPQNVQIRQLFIKIINILIFQSSMWHFAKLCLNIAWDIAIRAPEADPYLALFGRVLLSL